MAADDIIIGAPIFGNHPGLGIQASVDQYRLARAVRDERNSTVEVMAMQAVEYRAIIETLNLMGVRFKIAFGHEECIAPPVIEWLSESGYELVRMPRVSRKLLTYPRDIAIQPRSDLILVSSDLDDGQFPASIDGSEVRFSYAGEGGRALYHDGVVITNDEVSYEATFTTDLESNPKLVAAIKAGDRYKINALMKGSRAPVEELDGLGLRIGIMPMVVDRIMIVEGMLWHVPGDHIDLSCGLLRGDDGQLHFITEPKPFHHFLGIDTPPMRGPKQALEAYHRVCDELGIVMHVASEIAVQSSMNFVQFADGRVLMTGGDEEMTELVRSIVHDVWVTPIPIRYIPSWCKAGIRCLIGQWPAGLTRALQEP